MIEHTKRAGQTITLERAVQKGDNIVPRGTEARAGALLVTPQTRLGYSDMALAAQAGATRLEVSSRPRLAILSTGDEVVDARVYARSAPSPKLQWPLHCKHWSRMSGRTTCPAG